MKIIYISSASPESTLNEYAKKYKEYNTKNVQQRWDLSLAIELSKLFYNNFLCISYPPVATFPSSKCIFFNNNTGDEINKLHINYIKCCNLPIIKQCDEVNFIYKLIRKNINDETEKIILLTTTINYQSFLAYTKLKKKYKNIIIISIVPDLPNHMVAPSFNKFWLLKKLLKIYREKTINIEKKYDGYICFSKHQIKYLNSNVPNIIMEGFIDINLIDFVKPSQLTNNKKIVVYAGGIMNRYGAKELVDGFIKANLQNAELHFYGSGDALDYIKNKEDKNVFYKGLLSREKIISIEKSSYLLVNPRPIYDEYSWCSFPSKIMEYLATGTPTISSHLLCFEPEWDNFMTYFDDINEISISNTFKYAFKNYEQLKVKAVMAKNFIYENKSCECQANKIYNFIKENFDE